ncbi:MAG: RsmE family RNA methyltransferase [Candidatus Omnitrophota bacterium]
MSRFYVAKENIRNGEILITGKEAHHIFDVMRMHEGDKVVVFDGTGMEYTGFFKSRDAHSRGLIVEIMSTRYPAQKKNPEIILGQAIPKKGKMAYIVEKATELGVSGIIPLVTARTIVRPDDSGCRKKVERWQKKTVEAAKQCGRTDVPFVSEVTEFFDIIKQIDQYDLVLLAWLDDNAPSLKNALSDFEIGKILVLIGPEGDFTPKEVELANRGNCKFISLGQRVLKSDTAGLFVLSVLGYEFFL